MVYKKVLISVDNSEISSKVAKYGLKLASQLGAEIAIVLVADIEKANIDYETGRVHQHQINKLKQEATTTIDRIIQQFPDITFESYIPEGIPSKEIANTANNWKADIIVMGTHGKTGLKRLLIGSTTENTLRSSNIPILIVPCRT